MPTPIDPVAWHADLGGQFDSDSHGIVDFGVRRSTWALQLQTDTLDAHWTPHDDHGRGWLGARVEGGAAGLFITPWTDGAPDPSRALLASYGGLDGGYLRYGPHGLYAGAQAGARVWLFSGRPETTVGVPDPRLQVDADLLGGWWSPTAHAWAKVGLVTVSAGVSPRASFELTYHPALPLTPFIEARAGLAVDADDLSRTRLGGMVPYVVPVAGAAWAEWWVADYAAVRAGPEAKGTLGPIGVRVAPFADLAAFDGQSAIGLGTALDLRWGRAFLDTSVGYAPWIPRGEDLSRVSVYALAGIDWGSGKIGP